MAKGKFMEVLYGGFEMDRTVTEPFTMEALVEVSRLMCFNICTKVVSDYGGSCHF